MQEAEQNPLEKQFENFPVEQERVLESDKEFAEKKEGEKTRKGETSRSQESNQGSISQTQVASSHHASQVIDQADEELKLIEDILSDGMQDIYNDLPQNKKTEFKKKGEETAQKIKVVLNGVKIQIRKIINLIIDWLKIIPHVNKFFLKQEAKLKTDKIMEYVDQKKK